MAGAGRCQWRPLPPEEVKKARIEEMGYIFGHGLYRISTRRQCMEVTGKPPLKTGWADSNKGDQQNPTFRSRWVAKDFRGARRGGASVSQLFAGTPPLEALRLNFQDISNYFIFSYFLL